MITICKSSDDKLWVFDQKVCIKKSLIEKTISMRLTFNERSIGSIVLMTTSCENKVEISIV